MRDGIPVVGISSDEDAGEGPDGHAGDGEGDSDEAMEGADVRPGTSTPVWPPAGSSLSDLENWLESLSRLPPDDALAVRRQTLQERIAELRAARKGLVSPLVQLLRAQQASERRRRQLARFRSMRNELLLQLDGLKAKLSAADDTISSTEELLRLAEQVERALFDDLAASGSLPGGPGSGGGDAIDPVSQAEAHARGADPDMAAGLGGLISQLLQLPLAARAGNLESANAALLQQARVLHFHFTGNMGPTTEDYVGDYAAFVSGATPGQLHAKVPASAASPGVPAQGAPAPAAFPSPAESLGHEQRVRAAVKAASPSVERRQARGRSQLAHAVAPGDDSTGRSRSPGGGHAPRTPSGGSHPSAPADVDMPEAAGETAAEGHAGAGDALGGHAHDVGDLPDYETFADEHGMATPGGTPAARPGVEEAAAASVPANPLAAFGASPRSWVEVATERAAAESVGRPAWADTEDAPEAAASVPVAGLGVGADVDPDL